MLWYTEHLVAMLVLQMRTISWHLELEEQVLFWFHHYKVMYQK